MLDNGCNGEERHSHYVLGSSTMVTHIHKHTINVKDFNRLHHHPPIEHQDYSAEELTSSAETIEVPF